MAKNTNNNAAVKGEAPKKKRGIGRWFKELFSELKKVSWPSFLTVVKQTGVVLLVTLFFLLVLMGVDAGLGALYKLLMTGVNDMPTTSSAVASILMCIKSTPIFGALL